MRRIIFGFGTGAAIAASVAAGAGSDGYRQLEAHVHGHADLSVVADGDRIIAEFRTPLFNVVGFEHAPETDAQRNAYRAAIEGLRGAQLLFKFPGADCSTTTVAVEEPEFHDADTSHVHDADQDHGHDHESAQEADREMHHLDVGVRYEFLCKNLSQLKSITIGVFDLFEGIEVIKTVFVGEATGVIDLTPSHPTFDVDQIR